MFVGISIAFLYFFLYIKQYVFTDIKVTQHPDGKASAKPFFIIYDHQLYAQVDFISLLSTLHLLSRHFCYCVH
jgi:hypothetical protein